VTLLTNNFSAGPDGTSITNLNSGGGGDNAFDGYNNVGTSGRFLRFKSAAALARPTAEYVMECGTGATAGAVYVAWGASMGAQSQFWFRSYYRFTLIPNNFNSPGIFESYDTGTSTFRASIGISSSGTGELFTEDSGGTVWAGTGTSIIQDAWFRVEARFQCSATTGNGEVRYFEDADAEDPTVSYSFSNWNLGGPTANYYMFGYPLSDANLETMYCSGLALSNEDWIGPAPFRPGKGVPGILSNPVAIHSDTW
jgi:hypothetical protein